MAGLGGYMKDITGRRLDSFPVQDANVAAQKWQPNTAYAFGDYVVAPSGKLRFCIHPHISAATYVETGQTVNAVSFQNWSPPPARGAWLTDNFNRGDNINPTTAPSGQVWMYQYTGNQRASIKDRMLVSAPQDATSTGFAYVGTVTPEIFRKMTMRFKMFGTGTGGKAPAAMVIGDPANLATIQGAISRSLHCYMDRDGLAVQVRYPDGSGGTIQSNVNIGSASICPLERGTDEEFEWSIERTSDTAIVVSKPDGTTVAVTDAMLAATGIPGVLMDYLGRTIYFEPTDFSQATPTPGDTSKLTFVSIELGPAGSTSATQTKGLPRIPGPVCGTAANQHAGQGKPLHRVRQSQPDRPHGQPDPRRAGPPARLLHPHQKDACYRYRVLHWHGRIRRGNAQSGGALQDQRGRHGHSRSEVRPGCTWRCCLS